MAKIFVFGIDGASPELIFDRWVDELPNIKKLMKEGMYANMNSAIPPSTIVAWNSMISGKDTSEIGVFSYTYKDESGSSKLVSSKNIKCRLIWDILNEKNKRCIALYVPLSYPVKKINGCIVSDFLTPEVNEQCAYPLYIIEKIRSMPHPELFFDVAVGVGSHKALDIDTLLKKTYEMTDMQLRLLNDLLVNEEWDFFMAVMIGTDRLQHMLWRHFDESHWRFIKGSPYKNAIKDYYIYLDKELGKILKMLGEDTVVVIASDHGMIGQKGKININQWLIDNRYMKLKDGIIINGKTRFNADMVDMNNSIAYGGGAYNARIYINKEKLRKGGNGYEKIRQEIIEKLFAIPDDKGNKLDTKIYKPEEVYAITSDSECPDLTIYFDDLRWASNPDLGQSGIYSWESAVGADSAGHSRQGCFIIAGKNIPKRGKIPDIDIKQVAPTLLRLLDVEIPDDIKLDPVKLKQSWFGWFR